MKFSSNRNEDRLSKKRRLSEIGGQEIINLYDGGRLGVVADVDLLIDDETGYIEALLIPESKSFFSLFPNKDFIEVPCESVRKIGQDTLIVELDDSSTKNKGRP
jgi:YlmC/YmxH family sporulation protein